MAHMCCHPPLITMHWTCIKTPSSHAPHPRQPSAIPPAQSGSRFGRRKPPVLALVGMTMPLYQASSQGGILLRTNPGLTLINLSCAACGLLLAPTSCPPAGLAVLALWPMLINVRWGRRLNLPRDWAFFKDREMSCMSRIGAGRVIN